MRQVIIRNSIRCRRCGDEIESRHRHDFKWCSCGSVAVDGGTAYLRRVGETGLIEDTSIVEGGLRSHFDEIAEQTRGRNQCRTISSASSSKRF